MVQLCASLQGLCWAARAGRMQPSRPQPGVSAQPETVCLSVWAAGLQGAGALGVLPFPFSTEASRTLTDSGLQTPPEPGTASQGRLWQWCA